MAVVKIGMKNEVYAGLRTFTEKRIIKALNPTQFNWNKSARRILNGSSLSDSSLLSETYSAHVITSLLSKYTNVSIFKTEAEIMYRDISKKTDYMLTLTSPINGVTRIAVEVKRISDFNGHVVVDDGYVSNLLNKANAGSIESNKMVHPADRWHTQILHIITNIDNVNLYVHNWIKHNKVTGFSWVFITVVKGNYKIVF